MAREGKRTEEKPPPCKRRYRSKGQEQSLVVVSVETVLHYTFFGVTFL